MSIDAHTTLADLVTRMPHVAPVLERLGLDYCCCGQRPLAEAVAAAGLDLDQVLAELTDAPPTQADGAEWSTYGMVELVDHLEATHHRWLRGALVRLDELAAKVDGVHRDRHPELRQVRRLVAELRAELEPHLMKEERVLFPMIRQLATVAQAPSFHCGSLRNPIGVMQFEHEQTGELLAQVRAVTAGYTVPEDGCASYRALYDGLAELEADTHLHIHKENNRLFPQVVAVEARLAAPG